MLRPPFAIGPVSVFLLILSSLKFQRNGKAKQLTFLAKLLGTSSTKEQL